MSRGVVGTIGGEPSLGTGRTRDSPKHVMVIAKAERLEFRIPLTVSIPYGGGPHPRNIRGKRCSNCHRNGGIDFDLDNGRTLVDGYKPGGAGSERVVNVLYR